MIHHSKEKDDRNSLNLKLRISLITWLTINLFYNPTFNYYQVLWFLTMIFWWLNHIHSFSHFQQFYLLRHSAEGSYCFNAWTKPACCSAELKSINSIFLCSCLMTPTLIIVNLILIYYLSLILLIIFKIPRIPLILHLLFQKE